MAAVNDAGPVTRARIEAFDQTASVLSDFAPQWHDQAQRLQQAAEVYVEQVNTPNGTQWHGQPRCRISTPRMLTGWRYYRPSRTSTLWPMSPSAAVISCGQPSRRR